MTLPCPFCPTGIVSLKNDQIKSYVECQCGEHRSFGIDMSDRNHETEAFAQWGAFAKERLNQAPPAGMPDNVGGSEQDDDVDKTDHGEQSAAETAVGVDHVMPPDDDGERDDPDPIDAPAPEPKRTRAQKGAPPGDKSRKARSGSKA